MNFNRIFFMSIFILIITGLIFTVSAEEVIDPKIPESWYETNKTASEMGINKFNQSPLLEKRVEEGDLPSVEKRLPEDPLVIEPYNEIGEYGGTASIWTVGTLLGPNISNVNGRIEAAARPTPDGTPVPYLIKDWEYKDEAKQIVLFLRKGLKWSDGEPVNAEDYMYWWKHEATNEILNPTSPENWNPSIIDVRKEDDYTIVFDFGESAPTTHYTFVHTMGPGVWDLPPAHYMEQFHPDFVGEDKVIEMAENVGLERWEEFYERIKEDSPDHPDYEYQRPVLKPYLVVERSESTALLERNPYFPSIDTEGNQLPYIDKWRNNLANDENMAIMKATTGEATFTTRHTMGAPKQIPLFKENEEKGDYRTFLYRTSDVYAILPNLSHPDKKLRSIFQDERFRKALSLSINRENVSNKVFFGHATPLQFTVNPASELYEEEYGEAYADFDPERAKELLDDMGMVDRDGDGYREMPDGTLKTMNGNEVKCEGEKFNPTLNYIDLWSSTPILELVKENWRDIGLDIEIKLVNRELHDTRWSGNEGDIHVWPAGQTLTKYTIGALANFAPIASAPYSPWPAWVNWYSSGGESGEEPPKEIKKLIDLAETGLQSVNEDDRRKATKELLEIHSNKIYNIGVVAAWPRPIIAKNSLQNVPEGGYIGMPTGNTRFTHPEQFYLKTE